MWHRWLFFLCGCWLSAAEPALSPGLEHFYNLEYDEATIEFRQQTVERPENLQGWNELAQSILFREMFRVGALESEMVSRTNPFLRRPTVTPNTVDQQEFQHCLQETMSRAQTRLDKNANDLQALYALGVAHALRANWNFLVRKAWYDSLKDATAARKAHSRVVGLDPAFTDARFLPGIHDYLVGSLPFAYRMFGFLAGIRGDREGGINALKLVAAKGNLNYYDAQVFLAALYRREKRSAEGIPLLLTVIQRFPRNFLLRFELAQMYSDVQEPEKALAVLDALESLKRNNVAGFRAMPLEKVFYYRGVLLFWYRDWDKAKEQLLRVAAKRQELDLTTGVYTWLRLGQIYDVQGQRKEAVQAYRSAIAFAPQSDAAKDAQRYLSTPYQRTS